MLQIAALKGAARPPGTAYQDPTFRLYDIEADPGQERPYRDEAVEARLYAGLRAYMQRHDAPAEYYGWLGLEPGSDSRVAL